MNSMKKENPFENIEKSISELERNWENVVIKFIPEHCHSISGDLRPRSTDTPNELFKKMVVIFDNGIILINLPDWNFDWACSIISLAFERSVCGLDEQLAIYRHNIAHPNKNIAWKTYCAKKQYAR